MGCEGVGWQEACSEPGQSWRKRLVALLMDVGLEAMCSALARLLLLLHLTRLETRLVGNQGVL